MRLASRSCRPIWIYPPRNTSRNNTFHFTLKHFLGFCQVKTIPKIRGKFGIGGWVKLQRGFFFGNIVFFCFCFFSLYMFPKKIKIWIGCLDNPSFSWIFGVFLTRQHPLHFFLRTSQLYKSCSTTRLNGTALQTTSNQRA